MLGSSIARYGGSSFPFPLLVTVGSRSSLQTSFSNNWTLDFSPNIVSNTLPFYADDSCAPCFLQHLVPLLVVPTNFVPQKNKKTARVNTGLKKKCNGQGCPSNPILTVPGPFPLLFPHLVCVSPQTPLLLHSMNREGKIPSLLVSIKCRCDTSETETKVDINTVGVLWFHLCVL